MTIAYFDTIAGVSGDMTLGAFISAGLPLGELAEEIGKLKLEGVELQASRLQRSGITAVKVEVVISARETRHRRLSDIAGIIEGSALGARVQERAKQIFTEVARAEAAIHGTEIDKVHFHEVGALDSIVDIVGAAICLEKFGIDAVYSSPVKLGSGGFIEAAHGALPLPGPAAVEILRGYPTVLTDIPFELTTPTGAAIIKGLSSGTLAAESLRVSAVGYGAGTREIPGVPNLLRIMIGEMDTGSSADEAIVVESNIDDMNPEIFPAVVEQLIAAGAHDAYLIPVIMKKGRPGILLSALTPREKLDGVVKIFFLQTSTIGVRMYPVSRKKLARSQREVRTTLGVVKAKSIVVDGRERLVPEFEECRRVAAEKGIPLIEVYRTLERELGAGGGEGGSVAGSAKTRKKGGKMSVRNERKK